jgi:hypothetical protein
MSWRSVLGKGSETRKTNQRSHGQNTQNGQNSNCGHCGHCGHANSGLLLPLEPDTGNVTYHGFTLADLEAEAHADEWSEAKDRPDALKAFALALLEGRQQDAGIVPDRFTKLARCQGCGAVMVPAGWPTKRVKARLGWVATETWEECAGCPWCRLRLSGKAYPKPCAFFPAAQTG